MINVIIYLKVQKSTKKVNQCNKVEWYKYDKCYHLEVGKSINATKCNITDMMLSSRSAQTNYKSKSMPQSEMNNKYIKCFHLGVRKSSKKVDNFNKVK